MPPSPTTSTRSCPPASPVLFKREHLLRGQLTHGKVLAIELGQKEQGLEAIQGEGLRSISNDLLGQMRDTSQRREEQLTLRKMKP